MLKFSWYGAAVSSMALGMLAACAQTDTAGTSVTAPTEAAATGPVTDAQLRAYLEAKAEIDPITESYASLTPPQRTEATARIRAIQQRHNFTAVSYDAMARRAQSEQALRTRIAAMEAATLTEAEIRAFAAASLEIDPISQGLADATPGEREQAATRIRDVLTRHDLDGATYNAIVQRIQTDQALAQRIATLRSEASTPDEAE